MNLIEKIKTGCAELSPTCREASKLQSEALDHPLPPLRRMGLRLHLLICKWCRRYGRQIRFLRQGAGEHSEELTQAVPQQLSSDARARIKQRLQGIN